LRLLDERNAQIPKPVHTKKTSIISGVNERSGEFATFRENVPSDMVVPKTYQSVTMHHTPNPISPLDPTQARSQMYRSSSGDPTTR